MNLEAIRGQNRAIAELKKRLTEDRLQGSFLFAGPEGVGKRSTALALTAALFCETAPGKGCEQCATCLQVAQQNHPDLLILSPEGNKVIKVDSVRALLHKMSLQPAQADRKVILLDRPETLTVSAANALLKNLEEPGKQNLFLLISSTPGRLLPTILSRCQRVDFVPLAPAELEKLLTPSPGPHPESLLRLAGGSLTHAAHYRDWTNRLGCNLPTLFAELAYARYTDLKEWLDRLPTAPAEINLLLDGLRAVCRDLLLWHLWGNQAIDQLIFQEAAETIQKWGLGLTPSSIEKILQEINEMQTALTHNANPQLLWESLALTIHRLARFENLYHEEKSA